MYKEAAYEPIDCGLQDTDFTSALSRLGYRDPSSASGGPGRGAKKAAAEAEKAEPQGVDDIPGWDAADGSPRLGSLQLLLRLLVCVCKIQVPV